jgi:hypothetical protein
VTVNGAVASWNIDQTTDRVDCTYTNRLRQGAIVVTKTRKHAADGAGDHPHGGVSFTVNGVTKQTDATTGQACFDGLTWDGTGTLYDVVESVPTGYVSDDPDNTKSVLVDHNATCTGGGGNTVSFHNTPLTDLSISINSQVDGGTASSVSCTNGGPNGSTEANGDGTFNANNLQPTAVGSEIVCTIVIDP